MYEENQQFHTLLHSTWQQCEFTLDTWATFKNCVLSFNTLTDVTKNNPKKEKALNLVWNSLIIFKIWLNQLTTCKLAYHTLDITEQI